MLWCLYLRACLLVLLVWFVGWLFLLIPFSHTCTHTHTYTHTHTHTHKRMADMLLCFLPPSLPPPPPHLSSMGSAESSWDFTLPCRPIEVRRGCESIWIHWLSLFVYFFSFCVYPSHHHCWHGMRLCMRPVNLLLCLLPSACFCLSSTAQPVPARLRAQVSYTDDSGSSWTSSIADVDVAFTDLLQTVCCLSHARTHIHAHTHTCTHTHACTRTHTYIRSPFWLSPLFSLSLSLIVFFAACPAR